MATPNRAAILTKAHKTLKKHYHPVKPPVDRSILETMLYACCLENAPYEAADEAFAKLQETYYDWNEVRVTAVSELAESTSGLPDPKGAATNLKRSLQLAFETHYSFDIEPLRKQNIGKAEKQLEKYGATPFVVAYVKQTALGGHAIPIDKGAQDVLVAIGAVTEAEAAKKSSPGLERAISKGKGIEFGSLLHQAGADFIASPLSQKVRKVILEIDPQAKDRLPKRDTKKKSDRRQAEGAGGKRTTATKSTARTKKKPAEAVSEGGKKKSPAKRLARKKPR